MQHMVLARVCSDTVINALCLGPWLGLLLALLRTLLFYFEILLHFCGGCQCLMGSVHHMLFIWLTLVNSGSCVLVYHFVLYCLHYDVGILVWRMMWCMHCFTFSSTFSNHWCWGLKNSLLRCQRSFESLAIGHRWGHPSSSDCYHSSNLAHSESGKRQINFLHDLSPVSLLQRAFLGSYGLLVTASFLDDSVVLWFMASGGISWASTNEPNCLVSPGIA